MSRVRDRSLYILYFSLLGPLSVQKKVAVTRSRSPGNIITEHDDPLRLI